MLDGYRLLRVYGSRGLDRTDSISYNSPFTLGSMSDILPLSSLSLIMIEKDQTLREALPSQEDLDLRDPAKDVGNLR